MKLKILGVDHVPGMLAEHSKLPEINPHGGAILNNGR